MRESEAGSWRTINTLPFTETRGKKRDDGGGGSIEYSVTQSTKRSSEKGKIEREAHNGFILSATLSATDRERENYLDGL